MKNEKQNPIVIVGNVLSGRGIGKEIGFPTINVFYDGKISGVYAGEVVFRRKIFKAAIHVGSKPTVSPYGVSCEAHILNFGGEIGHGDKVKIKIEAKIRDTRKFENLYELKKVIANDIEFTKKYYKID